jgi:N-acetylmuramoyl-L-alanine amidase
LALRGLGILGLTAAPCALVMGCFQPGWMPSATLAPDVEPTTPRMVSTPQLSAPGAQAAIDGRIDPYGPPTLAIDPWRPAVPPRHWTYIVLHHTASSRGSVESIHEAHLQRRDKNGNPWMGIGYHFVVGNGNGMADGEVQPTFRWRQQLQGAHAGEDEHNQHGIGIAVVGNFELGPPSPAQIASLRRLVRVLRVRYGIEPTNIVRHSDIKATACPGKYFPLEEIAQGHKDRLLGATTPRDGGLRVVAGEPDGGLRVVPRTGGELVGVAAEERNRP